VVLFGIGLGAARQGLVQALEWKTEDARLKARAEWGGAPHPDLLLVGIDEKSLEDFGQWPFLRTYHGQLLEWLGREEAARPAAIAWDLLFIDRGYEWQIDQVFADAVEGAEFPVVLGAAGEGGARGIVTDG